MLSIKIKRLGLKITLLVLLSLTSSQSQDTVPLKNSRHSYHAISPRSKLNISYLIPIDFTRSQMDSMERLKWAQLVHTSTIVETSLERIFGIHCARSDIDSIEVMLKSTVGTMRIVYLINVHFKNDLFPSAAFVAKITRLTNTDYPTLFHETISRLLLQALGHPYGFIGFLPDDSLDKKLITTGPLYVEKTFSEWLDEYYVYYKISGVTEKDIYAIQVAVVKEVVTIWKKLGRIFIGDPHPDQFVIDYSPDSKTDSKVHLIDRGHIRDSRNYQGKGADWGFTLFLGPLETGESAIGIEVKGEGKIILNDVDLIRRYVLNQLPTLTEFELLSNLIANLELYKRPKGTSRVDYGEEGMGESLEYQYPFTMNPQAIVDGIEKALGRDGAIEFFKGYQKTRNPNYMRGHLSDPLKDLDRTIEEFLQQSNQILPFKDDASLATAI